MRDLVNVEAIPFDVLNQGITWDWETFPRVHGRRRARASPRSTSPSSRRSRRSATTSWARRRWSGRRRRRKPRRSPALIGEAIDAGAFGFSSTMLNQHMGFEGKPLACRNASREELKAYANELKARGKGAIEIALTRQVGVLEDDQCELLDFLLTESGRPVTFIALFDRDDIPEAVRDTLAPRRADDRQGRPAADLAAAAHARSRHAQSRSPSPPSRRGSACSRTRRRRRRRPSIADPAFRNQFREDLKNPTGFGNWGRIGVHEVHNPALKPLEGKSIAEIAAGAGQGRRRCLPRPHAGRRSRLRVHHGVVEHARGPHARASEQQGHPDGAGRRRRACRHAVRRRLPDLPARHLGAREAGDHARGGRAQADLRSGRPVRPEGSRPPRQGRAGRRGDLRSRPRSARPTTASAATTCRAAPSAS